MSGRLCLQRRAVIITATVVEAFSAEDILAWRLEPPYLGLEMTV